MKLKKVAVELSRVLIGTVFIFSGFVKAVDPWGYTYKILDYLDAFGLHFLDSLALPASIFISGLEFVLGVAILLGLYRFFFSKVLLLFMSFMTLLTLYLAIANPIQDCGCFGDAVILTNWQTFFKNIFLLAASVAIFLWYKQMPPLFRSSRTRPWVLTFISLFIISISLYCYLYLPILDFRPYKIGNNISEQMEIPDDAPMDEYEVTFIYEKDGVQQKFNIDNYPKTDDWTFVDRIDKLIKKGYEPPINDFVIYNEEGDDITDLILEDPSYSFLLVCWELEKASASNIFNINELYDYCVEYDYPFYCLTSSTSSGIENWVKTSGAEYPFLNADAITLKTIVRSNPGLVLLKEGTVINKWPNRCIPGEKELRLPLDVTNLGKQPANKDKKVVLVSGIMLIVPLFGMYLYDIYRRKKRAKRYKESRIKK